MNEGHHSEVPHDPAPPEPRFRMPAVDQLARGVGLGAVALAAGWLAAGAIKAHWLLAPASAVCGVVAALSAWAAAIHITGGERFDDHPFI